MVLHIMFTDLYTQNEEKNGLGGLPVADAALPREDLFH